MKTNAKLLSSILLLIILLANCEKDNLPENGNITSISGTIENWTLGTDKSVKIVTYIKINDIYTPFIFGSSSVDANGTFKIDLLKPSDALLTPLDSIIQFKLTISDHSTKVLIEGTAFEIYSPGITSPIGYTMHRFNKKPDSNSVGDLVVAYTYINKDCNISGSFTESIFNSSLNINVNLKVKAGWNRIVAITSKIEESSVSYEVVNNLPEGTKWNYYSYTNN